MFSEIDHMLSHKTSSNKFEDINYINIFSEHRSTKLEIIKNYRERHKHMETKQHSTKKPNGQRGNFKNILRQMKMETPLSKIYEGKQKLLREKFTAIH